MSKENKDLFALLREANYALGRGPRQGLTTRPGQNKVLSILDERGSMKQQDLVDELGIGYSSCTELLVKLEEAGFIHRYKPKTAKKYHVGITELGHVSALEHKLSEKERDETLFGKLEPEEKEELTRILNKLIAIWKEDSNEDEGKRRKRQWKENEKLQDEQREINAMLEAVEQDEIKKG